MRCYIVIMEGSHPGDSGIMSHARIQEGEEELQKVISKYVAELAERKFAGTSTEKLTESAKVLQANELLSHNVLMLKCKI